MFGYVPSTLLPPLPGQDVWARSLPVAALALHHLRWWRSLATGYPLLAPPAQEPSGSATLRLNARATFRRTIHTTRPRRRSVGCVPSALLPPLPGRDICARSLPVAALALHHLRWWRSL